MDKRAFKEILIQSQEKSLTDPSKKNINTNTDCIADFAM